ncbi:MAG: AAA family ATPase [Saprospiraceae bacterium]|nr:AAA family ATPase [Saprospiraceae bacterium]
MNNFDFHNLLAPTEFETFCTHVLEIRENPIKFTTYRRGRDGGIDIKSTNTQEKIIGQCKLYIPQNERGLINNLKKELLKCKRLKLDRYIICVNINLSVSLSKEILELFKGYKRCEEDIIDGQKLNKYLEQPAYEYLFKIYSKLLVPNLKAVEIALEKVINRKFYNISRTFLLDLIDKHKLYHNTEQLQHLIQKLEEDKVIILSGNPGVGKTTTAKMIANYFINRKKVKYSILVKTTTLKQQVF